MPNIIVAGLPGTGKKLVSEVLKHLGYNFGTVEDSQRTTLLCKEICQRLHPHKYPYYLVYDDWEVLSDYKAPILPESIVVAFPITLPSLLYYYSPTTIYYCRRSRDRWIAQARQGSIPPEVDDDHLRKVWDSDSRTLADVVTLIQARGGLHGTTFNVDEMRFRGQGEQADNLLNRLLTTMLKENPQLGL